MNKLENEHMQVQLYILSVYFFLVLSSNQACIVLTYNKSCRVMKSKKCLVFTYLVIITTTMADPRTQVVRQICNDTRAVGSLVVWVRNGVAALENLDSAVAQNGYGTTFAGEGAIAYYALTQCFEDLSSVDCKLCISGLRALISRCLPHIGGRLYLDGCFMRYANYSFFDEVTDTLDTSVCSTGNYSSDPGSFGEAVKTVLNNVASLAIKSNKGFAVSSASKTKNVTAYALAQCWQNLNTSQCAACLNAAAASVVKCAPAAEGRALFAGCYIRYSTGLFWNVKDSASNSSTGKRNILWIILGSCVGVLLLSTAILLWKKRAWSKENARSFEALYGSEIPARILQSSLNFSYKELRKATDNFNLSNKLGQGTYGTVYKAVLSGGKEVAVKRLFLNTRQCVDQFFNEVDIICQVRHKNLVKLLGCSVDGPESLLIHEYHCNRSLDLFIFAEDSSKNLDWQQKVDIIQGIVEGLCYLHEESEIRVIHRDIKASNILLDQKLKPKITDFGLARIFDTEKTHLTTGIAGTLGYMAPEYVVHGHLTEKADVFSCGMLILEIITGQRCSSSEGSHSGHSLLARVWNHYKANEIEKIVDERMYEENLRDEMMHMVQIGLVCTQANPSDRPAMSKVVELLRSCRLDTGLIINEPPFFEIDDIVGDVKEGNISQLSSSSYSSRSMADSCSDLSGR